MRAALVLAIIAATSAAVAAPKAKKPKAKSQPATKVDADASTKAEAPPPPPPPPAKPIDPTLQAVLDRIAKGDKAAVAELNELAPTKIADLATFLQRPHTTTVDERRAVLQAIAAEVPDEKGRFVAVRKSAKEEKADDDLDWLAALQKLDPATPGLGEVMADDAAIRALASTKDIDAAYAIFDAAFHDDTMIYRDECGRYLRKMEPYSIPALFSQAQARDWNRRRYSNYQLERIDRQEPGKALAAATGDENLLIAILDVWRKTKHREAVQAVWSKVNADSARTRAAARAAWHAYIDGKAPPPAPKKKLVMPGGKLTKKEKPLWLTYRELADNELRRNSNELLGTDYEIVDPTLDDSDEGKRPKKVEKIDLQAVTQALFDYYDKQRAEREAKQWAEADAKSKAGDLATATLLLDRLLAANPDHGAKAQMAQVYFTYAKELEKKGQWAEAAAAYSKANGLAPDGPHAVDALAAHHYMLGKAAEAQGRDGGPYYRKAMALRPDYAPAKEAAVRTSGGSKPMWMLYAALIAVAGSLGLFGLAMLRRRGIAGRRA